MNIKIKKHSSRVHEAIELCKLMTRNFNYEDSKKRLLEKYHFETFDLPRMMDCRIEIEREFKKEFKDNQKGLMHFFKRRSSNLYLADLLMELPYIQTEKRKCRYINDNEVNRSHAFLEAFLELELMDETYPHNINNYEDLSLLIEKIDLEMEDKWLIQTTYLHLEEEMKKFVSLINEVVEWLNLYEDYICEEEEAFHKYWSDFSSSKNLGKHLSQKLNIDISKKATTLWLVPSYFNCQSVYSKMKKDTIYVYMGTIFDESFSVEMKYETPLLICSQLKLLSDPSKFEILCTIKQRPHYGSELAKIFNLSTPTISHHMRSLENAGFIKIEKKDNKSFYSLDYERLSLFIGQVQNMLLKKEEP